MGKPLYEVENPIIAERRERRQTDEKVVYYRPKPPFKWMEDEEDGEA